MDPNQILLSCKMSAVQDLIAVYRGLAKRSDYALHLGLTEAGMGAKGTVASATALAVLLQDGIGDTIRVSLTPQPGEARTQEVVVALEILQSLGLRHFNPSVTACPGCARTTSTVFQDLTKQIDDFLRSQMPVWRDRFPGVEGMKVAVMGCIVNGPGESKHADIGISLPGTGEAPSAPVYIDGERVLTLRGDNIAGEFRAIVEQYIERRYGAVTAAHLSPRSPPRPPTPKKSAAGQRAARSVLLMAEILRAVKGMNDIFPASVPRQASETLPTSNMWQWFEHTARSVLQSYAHQNLMTPIVEPTALFVRGIGEVTDIVEKEMYSFEDSMNGDKLTLRPEFTAGIVRAVIEHNALYNGPLRLWSTGPLFLHARPQKGRYRQFHQLDVEALGFNGPDVDAEQILLTRTLLRELGLKEGEHIRLEINSLGQPAERAAHRAALVGYFEAHAALLDEDSRRRLLTNPLRILDSKNPAMQQMIDAAPKLMDFLGAETMAHFDAVRAVLDAVGLEYRINTRLVRGLDYYNLTVFEWIHD